MTRPIPPRSGDRIQRLLLGIVPRDLRRTYAPELLLTLRDLRRERRYRWPIVGDLLFALEAGLDLLRVRRRLRRATGASARGGPDVNRPSDPPRRTEPMSSSLYFDIRMAVRRLIRSPGMTVAALLTMAIGIGANAVMFSLVNGILLRPLPYPKPEELVALYDSNPVRGWPRFSVSGPNFVDYRDQNTVFDGITVYYQQTVTLTGLEQPRRTVVARVTAPHFAVWGIEPALGRGFRPEENEPDNTGVVVLGHTLWQQLGGDERIVGSSVEIDRTSVTVIGVLGPDAPQMVPGAALYQPMDLEDFMDSRGAHYFAAVARLRQGVGVQQASDQMRQIAAQLEEQYPETNSDWTVQLDPLLEDTVGDSRLPLLLLSAAVGLVLLIACANVANLLLARATRQRREVAMRAALGAGRVRLVRELLAESLLLALAGGGLGIAIAYGSVEPLLELVPQGLPRMAEVTVDRTVLGVTLIASVGTGLLFGLLPALTGTRGNLAETLKENGNGSAGAASGRLRPVLVVVEVALAVVVVIGAGLLGRSLWRLGAVDPGFVASGGVVASVGLPRSDYPDPEARSLFYNTLLEKLESHPRIEAAAAASDLPTRGDFRVGFDIEGRPALEPSQRPSSQLRVVSRGYFRTLGIPLLRGRSFEARDRAGAPDVTIINRSLAETFFGGEDPIGHRMIAGYNQSPDRDRAWTIIGVVGDTTVWSPGEQPVPIYYFVQDQESAGTMDLVVTGTGPPGELADLVRREVAALDPYLAVFGVERLDELLVGATSEERFRALLLSGFAALALLLASLGIYAVTAYSVACRTREMGIRMALGAQGGSLIGLVLRSGLGMALAGVVLGCVTALGATRLLRGLLFGVSATDPVTFVGVAGFLLAVAVAASLVPAWRATRVDPTEAMRAE